MLPYHLYFLTAVLISLVGCYVIVSLTDRMEWLKQFTRNKFGDREVSRLGGVALVAGFWLPLWLWGGIAWDAPKVGMLLASGALTFFGLWDDLSNLSWKKQLLFQVGVALGMVLCSVEVDYIANPWGGREFRLDGWLWGSLAVWGALFVMGWTVSLMNVVNWLDGLDGLAGSVGIIASLTLFYLSISDKVNQPTLGVMTLCLAGALLGFLVFNLHPAKIFMGSVGAMFLGFMLAMLSVFAGGKIATAFLVMGFPIFDALLVIVRRARSGKSPFCGDENHLQYNLLARGFTPTQVVLVISFMCALSGVAALAFSGLGKFLAITGVFVVFWFFAKNLKK